MKRAQAIVDGLGSFFRGRLPQWRGSHCDIARLFPLGEDLLSLARDG